MTPTPTDAAKVILSQKIRDYGFLPQDEEDFLSAVEDAGLVILPKALVEEAALVIEHNASLSGTHTRLRAHLGGSSENGGSDA